MKGVPLLTRDPSLTESSAAAAPLFYEERLASYGGSIARLSSRYRRLVNVEIGLTILLGIVFYVLYTHRVIDTAFAGVAAFLFGGLFILAVPAELLRRTAANIYLQRKVSAYYESRTKLLRAAWAGTGDQGRDLWPIDHPYCDDLDLFGSGSLFEYLCAAKTGSGRDWLASALLSPADFTEVQSRQQAIAELRGDHALRESLAGAARVGVAFFEGKALKEWLDEPPISISVPLQIVTAMLSAINVVAVFLAMAGRVSPDVALTTLALVGILTALLRKKTGPIIRSANPMVVHELELLLSYSRTLQSETLHAPSLQRDMESIRSLADTDMRKLVRRVKLMRYHEDPAFTYFSYLSLWGTLWAMAVEKYRKHLREAIRATAASIGEIEGLASLAAFSFEHPDYPFPSLIEGPNDDAPVFTAVGMGHPLIEPSVCVRNPVSIEARSRFVLVSGSNMSGKSTYLRSVGLNCVLARAGAPVCCDSLQMNSFSLAASMRVQDSLQDGKSRFGAEVVRVRQIVDQSKRGRVLFLLDELLSGTNSEDRRAGAAGLIARLLDSGASGFLTTHDLALVELVFSRPEIAKNVYFIDHLSDDQLAFDYRLREGIVPHSNGAAILRKLGIL